MIDLWHDQKRSLKVTIIIHSVFSMLLRDSGLSRKKYPPIIDYGWVDFQCLRKEQPNKETKEHLHLTYYLQSNISLDDLCKME